MTNEKSLITKNVPSYDNSMMSFTNRWAALSIDILVAFIMFFIARSAFNINSNWPMFIAIYTICHILVPTLLKNPRSIGKIIMRVDLIYPESYRQGKRRLYFALREVIKGVSILATAGLILIITPIIISEKERLSLHEYFTKVIAKRHLGKNDRITDDHFEGKLNL